MEIKITVKNAEIIIDFPAGKEPQESESSGKEQGQRALSEADARLVEMVKFLGGNAHSEP